MKKKFMNKPKREMDKLIKKFNEDHNFTKVVGMKKSTCWVLDIRVGSYKDKRKALCHFRLNVWPDDSYEKISDTINDKYAGVREFLEQHPGVEDKVIAKVVPPVAVEA